MKKILIVAHEIEYDSNEYGNFSNKDIANMYDGSIWDLEDDLKFASSNLELLAVLSASNSNESEVDNGDSTGEITGATGIDEVPC